MKKNAQSRIVPGIRSRYYGMYAYGGRRTTEGMPVRRLHFIEGEPGCRFARERGCAAVIVDALRASATAAMLLEAGAVQLHIVAEVEAARAARAADPEALLAGERNCVPLEDFDLGNSPRETAAARGRRVVFSTTTGAGRMVSAWGAPAVCMGTCVNAAAVAEYLERMDREAVLIPAGLLHDPQFEAQEDRAAAAYLGTVAGGVTGEGAAVWRHWAERVEREGLDTLFQQAPHAEKLRRAGLEADIAASARVDWTRCVPVAMARTQWGVLVRDGANGRAAVRSRLEP